MENFKTPTPMIPPNLSLNKLSSTSSGGFYLSLHIHSTNAYVILDHSQKWHETQIPHVKAQLESTNPID